MFEQAIAKTAEAIASLPQVPSDRTIAYARSHLQSALALLESGRDANREVVPDEGVVSNG